MYVIPMKDLLYMILPIKPVLSKRVQAMMQQAEFTVLPGMVVIISSQVILKSSISII